MSQATKGVAANGHARGTTDPGRPSVKEIARWLAAVVPGEHAIEVRAPGALLPGRDNPTALVQRFPPLAYEKAAQVAYKLSGCAPSIYCVMNGINPALPLSGRNGASAKDIPRRLRLLIDCDPVRAAGVSATDAEKALAREAGAAIRRYLTEERGWPDPIIGDSGNGDHSVYAIDLPNTPESNALVKSVLEVLAVLHNTDAVHVDTVVHDPPRLVKLYGTLAAKGEPTDDRPHRYSRLVSAPEKLEVVTEEMLRSLVEDLMPHAAPAADFDLEEEIRRKRGDAPRPDGAAKGGKGKKAAHAWPDGLLPGDDFNARGPGWEAILPPHGWKLDHTTDSGVGHWTRPGKGGGTSATTGYLGDWFYCFSSSVPEFTPNKAYSRFQVYVVLNHAGDFKAAATELSRQGYGNHKRYVKEGGGWVLKTFPNPCPKGQKIAGPGDAPPVEFDGFGKADRGGTASAGGGEPPPSNGRADMKPHGFRRTDFGNAERLVALHGDDLRFVHPWKKWLAYDGQRWQMDNTAAVVRCAKRAVRSIYREAADEPDDAKRKEIVKWAADSESRARVEAMIKLAAAEPRIPVLPEDLDKEPWLLNVRNGTLDLTTGEIRPHRRTDMITRLCQVEYDKGSRCPLWEATLDKIFARNDRLIRFWQRLCGFCLTGVTTEQILPILHGCGANGKSTILNTLLKMLGPDYAMKAPPNLLMVRRSEVHPTEQADLFGKRLVVAIESGEDSRINETLIKELTGSDNIRARRMREDHWEFEPTHKILLCTNHQPQVRGTDHAIWRRLKMIPFTVTIPDDQADKNMPTKLLGELPGILAWCVTGCLEWQASGLNPPEEVTEATEEYRKDEDTVAGFLADHCAILAGARAKASRLYERFRGWCERSGETAVNQRKFGRAMTEKGFRRITNNGIWYEGIGLRDDQPD